MSWLKWLIAGHELAELHAWQAQWREHRQWFAEFESVRVVLDRMDTLVRGSGNVAAIDVTRHALRRPASGPGAFQPNVSAWMAQCFEQALATNITERCDRFLEEALELLQSLGYDRTRVTTLVEYVFGRPIGEAAQEVGGVMVTLAALCSTASIDMHAAGEAELNRIQHPDVMAKIRAKQQAKNALRFDTPLPGNSTTPASETGVTPDGYAYRYPDGAIRHNNGRELNGSKPVEAIPYCYKRQAPADVEALPDSTVAAWVERHDLEGALGRGADARAAFDDARTAYMLDKDPAIAAQDGDKS